MPKLIDKDHCPHCGASRPKADAAEDPTAVCTSCGGSLQQRHLRAGCLSTAPLWFLFAFAAIQWLR
ncbi:MAG: hypothetical protein O2816_07805 [Planctomycetota bacterium]|nr:hypothetical protein [Planctomycetota bacterium]